MNGDHHWQRAARRGALKPASHDGVTVPRVAGEFVLDSETGRFTERPPQSEEE
jgi:hypothetical protein